MDKKEFVKLSVHEIKTPISVIHGFADLINYGIISGDELEKTACRIKREAMRMAKFVDEMAFYIELEEEVKDITFDVVDLRALLGSVAGMIKEKTEENVNITVNGRGQVYGNCRLLENLFSHIIENGIIYNDRANKKIICNIEKSKGKIRLTIEDNGIGIDEREVDSVFQCFYRVDKSKSRGKGCNGMGLSVCRKIANAHNADIMIDSQIGKGTKVTVEFEG